ncbi:MAG: dihydroorotase, partial [Ignavibacteria bacterium]|nr:dihydroorotase [Ignavibacteria bacterium]
VLRMPNTKPPVDNRSVIDANKRKSENKIVDVYTSACATRGRKGKEISDVDILVESGARAITDDGSPVEDEEIMEELFRKSSELGFPVVQHCEIMKISDGGVINKGRISEKLNLKGIPNESEYKLIERDLNLLGKYPQAKYHIQHISTKESVELVRSAKREGLNVTSEVCPHHFILTDEAVEKYGTNAKMNPPLRTRDDVNEILTGLKDGTIDVICTDHAPHSDEEKLQSIENAPFGIIGLETSVALSYEYLVKRNIITFEEMIMKMSVNPRRILGLGEIRIREGDIANLTVINLRNWIIDRKKFHSKSRNTPFDGWEVSCKAEGIVNKEKFLINV